MSLFFFFKKKKKKHFKHILEQYLQTTIIKIYNLIYIYFF